MLVFFGSDHENVIFCVFESCADLWMCDEDGNDAAAYVAF